MIRSFLVINPTKTCSHPPGSTASSEKATVERLMEEGEYSVADCTVKAVTKVQYVSISREVYLKAVRKTAHLRKMRKLSGDLLKNDHDKPAGSNGWLRSKLSRNSGGPVDIKVMSGQMDHLLPQSGDRTVEDEASQRSCESPTEGDKLTNHSANGSLTIELTSKRVWTSNKIFPHFTHSKQIAKYSFFLFLKIEIVIAA